MTQPRKKNAIVKAKTIQAVAKVPESPTPATLLQMAITQNLDLDKLEKLMELQERWEQKEAKKLFIAALSKFQSMVPPIRKNKTAKVKTQNGGGYDYTYVNIGHIGQTIQKALNKCELSYRWEFDEKDGKMSVRCFVTHISGHTEGTTMEAAADNSGGKNAIQQKASTNTYLQRYTLIGALGLTIEDDDNDGKTIPGSKKEKSMDETKLEEWEVLEQWKTALAEIKTQIHLTTFYQQNKKAVDSNKKVQALFKAKEAEVKGVTSSNNPVTKMP